MKRAIGILLIVINMYAGVSFNNSIGSQYDSNINTIRERQINRQFYINDDYYNGSRRTGNEPMRYY